MADAPVPGLILGGRYRLEAPLARGGMAQVWSGEDVLLARRVAVKTLLPELAVREDIRIRFRREAVAAARLAHPGVVATYDTGEDGGIAYIVMELVDGVDLRALLDERGPLPLDDALRIARAVAGALAHAHRHGIVHRDVKPANVLMGRAGSVKMSDFGIAKTGDVSDLTGVGTVMGTARYLAPEQVRGEPTDARADVYALGLLVHEMLTGRLPFRGDTEAATALARLSVAPVPLDEDAPYVPAGVAAFVARCLALRPAERFPDAAAALERLEALTLDPDAGAPHHPPPPPPHPHPRADATVARDDSWTRPGSGRSGVPPRGARGARSGGRHGRRVVGTVVVLGAAAGGLVAGYLLVRDATRGPSGPPPEIVAIADFDPEGDNRQENPQLTAFAIDGAPGTAWTTERYATPDLGGVKSGVGLVLTLARPSSVRTIEIDAAAQDWSVQVYAGTGATTLAGWGSPVGAGERLGTTARLDIDPDSDATAVLLWFTRVPPSGRLEIREVRLA